MATSVDSPSASFEPVSAEARGKVRQLVAQLETSSAVLETAARRVPRQLLDGSWKGRTGSARGIEKLCRLMPRPPDHVGFTIAIWRWLRPYDAIPGAEAEAPQACLAVRALVGARRRPSGGPEFFGLCVTTHAVGRFFDRTAFAFDAGAALFSAHNALLALDRDEGSTVFGAENVVLPAGPGYFLAKPAIVGKQQSPIQVARTWLHVDQGKAAHVTDAQAWSALVQKRTEDAGIENSGRTARRLLATARS